MRARRIVFGFTPNPDGFRYRDLGFGNFLGKRPPIRPQSERFDWLQFAPTTDGQFQVSTARNVAMTPPQCPTTEAGPGRRKREPDTVFPEGVLPQWLYQEPEATRPFLQTRATRVILSSNVTSGHCPPGTTGKRWTAGRMKEVLNNLDMTTGMLGLTDQEENQIVAFLQALTDGFDPANSTVSTYPNIDTFTGQCTITAPGVNRPGIGGDQFFLRRRSDEQSCEEVFPLRVRARAVRLVLDQEAEHPSRWAAMVSVAEKIGCLWAYVERVAQEGRG